jgi:hypothetical protein
MSDVAYYVEVRNLTRGWTMTSTHGDIEDLDDEQLDAVLVAPLRIRWAFERGLIPGHLEPVRVSFGIWARTVTREQAIDLGDVVAVDVRLGPTGPYLYRFEGGRVTEAPTDLVPGQPWASRTTVEVADFLADASSKFPVYGNEWGNRAVWQTRLAMVGAAIGYSIGIPSALATMAVVFPRLRDRWFGDSAASILTRILNSRAPNDVHHTLTVRYTPGATAYPTGWVWAEPADRVPDEIVPTPLVPDPLTWIRYLVAPASRREPEAYASPLQFAVVGGRVTLSNTPGGTGPRKHPALAARWCRIPTSITRRRDHLINTSRLKGFHQSQLAAGTTSNYDKAASLEVTNAADVATRGNIAREVDTDLVLREYASDETVLGSYRPGTVEQANTYLSDASVLVSNRAYDSLDLDPGLMTAAEHAAILPYLVPTPPGLGDGRVLRHLTVWGLSDDVASANVIPGGFVSGGELVIERGRVRYAFTTTPGQPIYTGTAPTPITVGAFRVKALATAYPVSSLDPTIRVADAYKIGA